MGSNYKKLLSGVVVVTTLSGTQILLAKTAHTSNHNGGGSNGDGGGHTGGEGLGLLSDANATTDAESILKGLIAGSYPKENRPTVENIKGQLHLKPASQTVQDYDDLMDWLYSESDRENSKIVMMRGRLYVNIARPGQAEQLLSITLPKRPELPAAEPPDGHEPGGLVP